MRKGILLLIICTAFQLTANAQQQDAQARKITLQQAIDIALKNNYQLKKAENNVDLAKKGITSEYADFFPSISGDLSGSSRQGQQLIRQGNQQFFQDNVTNSISGSLGAQLPIFNGFQNIISLRISKNSKLSSEERLQWAKQNVIFSTASAFLQVLLDKQLLDIANENLASSKKTLEQVQAQVDVGSRPTVDLYNQQATVANDELQVVNQENALELSRLKLVRQMQVDPLKKYEFVTPRLSKNDVSNSQYQLSVLVNSALDSRADLKSQKAELETLDLRLKQARYNLLPSLNASIRISSLYSDKYFGGGVSFHDQFFDQNYTESAGLSLSVPIFNNLNRTYQIQSAKVSLKNAKLDLENSKLQVIQEVNQAYNDYQAYQKQLQSTEKALQAAQKSYETQQERYQVGAGTLIELSDANARFVQAKSNHAQAVYRLIFQQKLVDYYVGKLNANISLTN